MEFLAPFIQIIVGLFSFLLVLRTWLQFCRVDPYMPISQTLMRLTNPVLNPLSKLIPTVNGINFAALLLAAGIVALQFVLFGVDVPRAVLIGLLSVVKTFGQILFFTTCLPVHRLCAILNGA